MILVPTMASIATAVIAMMTKRHVEDVAKTIGAVGTDVLRVEKNTNSNLDKLLVTARELALKLGIEQGRLEERQANVEAGKIAVRVREDEALVREQAVTPPIAPPEKQD